MASKANTSQPRPQWQITEDYIDSLKGATHRGYLGSFQSYDREILDLLKTQLLLCDGFNDLRREIQGISAQINTNTMQSCLNDIGRSANAFHHFINEKLRGNVLVHLPSNESAVVAQQAFETLELAEMIFVRLCVHDLFNIMGVNQAFASGVALSPILQKELYLQPDPCAYFQTFFTFDQAQTSAIECDIQRDERPRNLRTNEVEIQVSISRLHRWFQFEQRYPDQAEAQRKMLICKPPVYEVSTSPSCCYFYRPNCGRRMHRRDVQPSPPVQIVSPTALTVGDFLHHAQKIAHAHRHCPFADEYDHNNFGIVEVGVYFSGKLTLPAGDPAIPRWYENEPGPGSPDYFGEEMDRRENSPTEKEKYFDAKHEAFENGLPVPTFEEWQEAQQRKGSTANLDDEVDAFDVPRANREYDEVD